MPVYEYVCPCCHREWDAFHKIDDRHNEFCCERQAIQLISKTAMPVVTEYFSENLGAVVTGPEQRKRLMKERGLEAVG